MTGGWVLFGIGLGAVALSFVLGEPRTAPVALGASQRADTSVAESTAIQKCEAAVSQSAPAGFTPQFTPSNAGSRLIDGRGRLVKVAFTAKNPGNVELDFGGWCEVWPDGRTEIVSIIETAGRDLLASSHQPSVRDAYLQRVSTARIQTDPQNFTRVITNLNGFPIKSSEVTCQIRYTGSNHEDDLTIKIGRVIPAGGSTKFQLPRLSAAQSVTCRVTDFLVVSSAEQRLIKAFGPAGGQSGISRLRQDAIRHGVPIDTLVEPYIALAKALASESPRQAELKASDKK